MTCGGVGLWNCRSAGVEPLAGEDGGNRILATKYLFLTRTILCNWYGSFVKPPCSSLQVEVANAAMVLERTCNVPHT